MTNKEIIVVGGGASGILAAIVAARNGAHVTILERNVRIGKKILATGNGRCNYTNTLTTQRDYNHPEFVADALDIFSPETALTFFTQLGISPKIEDEGKTYPLSEQASSILDVLMYELNHLNVDIITNAHVQNINKNKNNFTVLLADQTQYKADKVILCTGGKAMPSSGSDGLGYPIARKLGHHVTTIFPALVKLKLDYPYLKQMDGVKISSIVQLVHQNRVIKEEKGDILFTSYGISGPTILQLSRKANELVLKHETVYINVILVNSLSKDEVYQRFSESKDKPVDFSLIGLINKKLISAVLKEAKIEKQNTLVSELKDQEIDHIVNLLFSWKFVVTGSKGFEDAQVTAGGIDINEIDSKTMESKLISGLYIAGEVMDIDGPCGGYNLQWAWSSAYVAGLNASK
ncbi:MAG: NAD(P)/FAD-dependent oxidoreductase [Firmicutes bacterium]|nr:NAD(P)/FAD-dependent oxidoreductase [Bacillota bacterium]